MSNGERDFGELYAVYQPRVFRYLARHVGASDAEDLTQAVFLKVSQALKDFRGESALSTWIWRIAANTAKDWLRGTSAKRAGWQISMDAPSGVEAARQGVLEDENRPQSDRLLIRREMNQCIRQVVEGLPEPYREVIALSEFQQLKNAEIANTLGVSIGTVKIRLHRARAMLRRALEIRCDLYRDAQLGLACDAKTSS